MKKVWTILLTLALILSLCACTNEPAPTQSPTAPQTEAPTTPQTEAPKETMAPTEPQAETMAQPAETDAPAPAADIDPEWLVISQCEEISPWFGTTPEVRTDNAPQGNAYLMSTNVDENTAAVFAAQLPETVNALAYKDGYFHIWVYIENLDYVLGGQIEVCTGNNPDVFETSWEVPSYLKNDGWNELYLPLASAGQGLKPAQLGMINYIRFYVLLTQMCDVGMDMVYFCKEAPTADLSGSLTEVGAWRGTGVRSGGDPNEFGENWLKATERDEGGSIVFCADYAQPMDLSAFANGEIHLSLYLENASLIGGGQIEFTSSGGADAQETSWDVAGLTLADGWNKIVLKIADGSAVGGETNWSAINYIRIYLFSSDNQTAGLGAITLE